MNSIKCPECGLVNFAEAEECKRCHLKFHPSEPAIETSSGADQPPFDMDVLSSTDPEPPVPDPQEEPPAPLPEYFDDEPETLNAPMVLFAVYLFLGTVVLVYQMKGYVDLMYSVAWKHMIDPRDQFYISSFEPLLYLLWIMHILGVLGSILLIILLLRRSHSFLRWVRVYLLGSFVYFGVQLATGLTLRSALMEKLKNNREVEPQLDMLYWTSILSIIGFLVAFIWFRYFTTSNRVKNTFIN